MYNPKNIEKVTPFYINASVEPGVCPIDWLAKYYRKFYGKLVMVDRDLMNKMLNHLKYDSISETEFDGYAKSFTLTWNATEEYPETKVVLTSYGKDEIVYHDGAYEVPTDTNYYVIEELVASDVLEEGETYATERAIDRQIILLSEKQYVHELEHTL